MSKKARHIFFILGIVAIIFMAMSFELTYQDILVYLGESGWYLVYALLLWAVIYFINTFSWRVILKSISKVLVPFRTLYKFTVTGFALNYVTPGGLNGGEPYRILELKNYIGTSKAISSTILYSVAHVGSHVLFWMIGAVLLCLLTSYWIIALVIIGVGLLILISLYNILKVGIADFVMKLASKVPWAGRYVSKIIDKHQSTISNIDVQINYLCHEKPKVLCKTISIELFARIVGCIEVILIPVLFGLNFAEAYLVIAISSLMGNLLFFMPMQLGGREGGFVLAFSMLNISVDYGLFIAILFRVRELILIAIGVLLLQLKTRQD